MAVIHGPRTCDRNGPFTLFTCAVSCACWGSLVAAGSPIVIYFKERATKHTIPVQRRPRWTGQVHSLSAKVLDTSHYCLTGNSRYIKIETNDTLQPLRTPSKYIQRDRSVTRKKTQKWTLRCDRTRRQTRF